MNATRILASSLLLAALAGVCSAQSSRTSLAGGGAGNSEVSPTILGFNGTAFSDTEAAVSNTFSESFTGQDQNSDERTMTFSGSAFAQTDFGRLRTRATGRLENSYYNADNAPFYDGNPEFTTNPDGSPDVLVSTGSASFTDELIFGGTAQAGYLASYKFRVTGQATGQWASASIQARIANNLAEFRDYGVEDGVINEIYVTGRYPVAGSLRQTGTFSFGSRFRVETFDLTDGDTVAGSADFSATAVLEAILLFDASGNPVSGYTVTGESGTVYPTAAPVPEPATLAALGLGAAALLRRRRRG